MPNLPNWPGALPTTPQEPAFPTSIPLHTTIQEAKAAGVVTGDIVAATLAPAKGPIDAEPESIVAVTVKKFKDSPTYRAVRAVVLSAVAVVALTFSNALLNVWASGKSIFDAGAIDWKATERVAEIAAGPVLVAGLMALMKKKDNNPVQ